MVIIMVITIIIMAIMVTVLVILVAIMVTVLVILMVIMVIIVAITVIMVIIMVICYDFLNLQKNHEKALESKSLENHKKIIHNDIIG